MPIQRYDSSFTCLTRRVHLVMKFEYRAQKRIVEEHCVKYYPEPRHHWIDGQFLSSLHFTPTI